MRRFFRPDDADIAAAAPAAFASEAPCELPEWLFAALPAPPAAGTLLRPSDGGGSAYRPGESVRSRAHAMLRGTLAHRLLQSLPEIAATRRRDAALDYLARNAVQLSEDLRGELAATLVALIEDPRFAAVFAAGSRAEVAIVGRPDLPGRPLVSGQVDRLVVTASEVLIVDFKTNHNPPKTPAAAPAAYLRQLALYRAVLGKLYPQRAVRTALLWTETPELMELSTPALDAALASFERRAGALDPATPRS